MSEPLIVFTTVGNPEQAKHLGRELVESRLAACVSCMPDVVSIYRWAGAVQEDSETLLWIKTTRARVEALRLHLLRIHPYEAPEFLVVSIEQAGEAYLRWLEESTAPAAHAPGSVSGPLA